MPALPHRPTASPGVAPVDGAPLDGGPYSLAPALATGVLFVHVPKTGGTSVARALYGTEGVGHRTVREVRAELGRQRADALFSFAVVRDPVDRAASAYRYLRAGGSNALDAAFGARVLDEFSTFEAFVLGWLTPRTSRVQVHFRPQADFVCDGGRVAVDRVVPYARLAEGYARVRAETGVGGPLPHANAGPGPAAAAPPLSAAARARLREVYAADYDHFDFPDRP